MSEERLAIHVLRKGMLAYLRGSRGGYGRLQEWSLHVKCRVLSIGKLSSDHRSFLTMVKVTESGAVQFRKGTVVGEPTFGVAPRTALYWQHSRDWDHFSEGYVRTSHGHYRPWGVIPDDPAHACPATLVTLEGRLMRVHTLGDLKVALYCPFTGAQVLARYGTYETVKPGSTYYVDYYGAREPVTIPGVA